MKRFLSWLYLRLLNQRGETPDTGTAGDANPKGASDGEGAEKATSTTDGTQASSASGGDKVLPEEENFIDPKDLPEEIKPHWKRMHGAYNKRLSEIRDVKSKAETVDKFWSDEAYARQVLASRAAQLGLTVSQANGDKSAPAKTPSATKAPVPSELLEIYKDKLGAGNEEMAEAMAAAHWAGMQATLRPLAETAKRREAEAISQEYERHAQSMTEKFPGWEEDEEDLVSLLDYLQSSKQDHPTFGSKLSLLYHLNRFVKGDDKTIVSAIKRMGAAVKGKVVTGSPSQTTLTNIEEKVKQAAKDGGFHGAFEAAAQAAIESLKDQGRSLTE